MHTVEYNKIRKKRINYNIYTIMNIIKHWMVLWTYSIADLIWFLSQLGYAGPVLYKGLQTSNLLHRVVYNAAECLGKEETRRERDRREEEGRDSESEKGRTREKESDNEQSDLWTETWFTMEDIIKNAISGREGLQIDGGNEVTRGTSRFVHLQRCHR